MSTRASKAAKTGDATSPKAAAKKGAKRGPKVRYFYRLFSYSPSSHLKHNGNHLFRQTSITATAFKSKATPLHINITHTAPPEATEGETKDEKETSDPGHVASATLLPSVFSTGSYGWKGSKRVSIEVEKENGEKETVQVMIRYV